MLRLVRRVGRRTQDRSGWTRGGLIGSLLVLVVAAGCIRLGIWQLDRLEQRRAVNALAMERMSHPPVAADELPGDSSGAAFRRLLLTGSCEGAPIVLAARSRRGAPGVHLLCRFRTDGGRLLLLDRGWLPSADARTVDETWLAQIVADTTLEAIAIPFPPGETTTRPSSARTIEQTEQGVSIGDPAPRVIYRLNRAQAREVVGAELPAWYAQAVGPADGTPVPPDPPVPADPPDLSEGPHLGYAVQWFSFAAIALIGWLVLLVRRRPASSPVE